MYCHYYQAKVLRKKAWFLVGGFRNEENIAFVRALESSQDLFVTSSLPESLCLVIKIAFV